MRLSTLCLLALGAVLELAGSSFPAAGAGSLPPEAEAAARRFITALARNDLTVLREMTPRLPANLFGPCPYRMLLRLGQPRVDMHRAAVEVEGELAAGTGRARGMLLLVRKNPHARAVAATTAPQGQPPAPGPGPGLDAIAHGWRVRQFVLLGQHPPASHLPKSRTRDDRAQEAVVAAVAREYFSAWIGRPQPDYDTLLQLRFDPWQRPPRSRTRVSLSGLQLGPAERVGEEYRVPFQTKARAWLVFSRRVRGRLALMQEEGSWRARVDELSE